MDNIVGKIRYLSETDDALTILLPDKYSYLLSPTYWDICCDLTICKGLMKNKTSVWDMDWNG